VHFRKASDLNTLLPNMAHQGIVAFAKEFQYTDLEQLIHHPLDNSDPGLLIAADHITDEGNLGALIRTAVFFGVHGLILPKDRSAQVTDRVRKRSSGATIHLPIAKVVNLGRTLDRLNNTGFWIIGAAGEGPESIYQCDWNRDIVLVLGREDKGLTDSVRKRCHQIVHIPGTGTLDSLNVTVAGGVILSEIVRQRQHHTHKICIDTEKGTE
jgi:23S rRNA (guanosine2251-2'-O)-methyltransferase